MQDWKGGQVPVSAKREPRGSANHTGRLLTAKKRKETASAGGDPKTITHQGTSRRGSRGRNKAALAADQDLQEYHGELALPETPDLEGKVEQQDDPPPPAKEETKNPSTPYRWTLNSYTPEALAEADREFAPKERPSRAAMLAASRDLQETYRKTHGKGGPKNRRQEVAAFDGVSKSPREQRLPNSHLLTPKKPKKPR